MKPVKNHESILVSDIEILSCESFCKECIALCQGGARVVELFALDRAKNKDDQLVFVVLADDLNHQFLIGSTYMNKAGYPSLTQEIPAFSLFERELFETTGIIPIGHPWLKPARKIKADYPFLDTDSDQLHRVGVGPVHAGIIEPGYFRFLCLGEKVLHLEIALGFQHRGLEALIQKSSMSKGILLAETIAGDTAVGHSLTYAMAMEALAGCVGQSQILRGVGLELERIAMHIGDLSGICTDIAFTSGAAEFQALRTKIINTTQAICGNRFGKSLIQFTSMPMTIQISDLIKGLIPETRIKLKAYQDALFNATSVLSRLERTGTIPNHIAQKLGLSGFLARSSGLSVDTRLSHPFGIYQQCSIQSHIVKSGDVSSRVMLRFLEVFASLDYLEILINQNLDSNNCNDDKSLMPNRFVISAVEGWRGEIIHIAITDETGHLMRYKIKDPSFHNWDGLAYALRNEEISDFPLCNKSCNLSYCGYDL